VQLRFASYLRLEEEFARRCHETRIESEAHRVYSRS